MAGHGQGSEALSSAWIAEATERWISECDNGDSNYSEALSGVVLSPSTPRLGPADQPSSVNKAHLSFADVHKSKAS